MIPFKQFILEVETDTNYVGRKLFDKNYKRNLSKGHPTHLFSFNHAGKDYGVHSMHSDDVQDQIQIRHENKPIGYIDARFKPNKHIHVTGAAIHTGHQGTGLMTKTYEQLALHGHTIHGDEQQSPGAKKMWSNLDKNPKLNVNTDTKNYILTKKGE